MSKWISLAACIALFLPACALFDGEDVFGDPKGVFATATPPDLVVVNGTRDVAYTFVTGRKAAASIRWAPSVDGRGLAPGARERLPYADFQKTEEEVIVYWWQAVVRDGERVHGQVRRFIVEL